MKAESDVCGKYPFWSTLGGGAVSLSVPSFLLMSEPTPDCAQCQQLRAEAAHNEAQWSERQRKLEVTMSSKFWQLMQQQNALQDERDQLKDRIILLEQTLRAAGQPVPPPTSHSTSRA